MSSKQSQALRVFLSEEGVGSLPTYSTVGSSCFDVRVGFSKKTLSVATYKRIPGLNEFVEQELNTSGSKLALEMKPGYRYAVPTGLIFCIPVGYSVRLYSRSGLSFKSGLVLANGVGIIDSDYTDPLFLLMTNKSGNRIVIQDGERIAQGELVNSHQTKILPIRGREFVKFVKERQQNSIRRGGFGSTGTK